MSRYFSNKKEFDNWLINFEQTYRKNQGESLFEQLSAPELTDDDYIKGLLADGYTDLDNLISDGHRYAISGHTNNGWLYRDEADMNYIKQINCEIELRER